MLRYLPVVILVAVAVYLTVRAIQRRGIAPTPRTPRRTEPPRAIGPDDDPDFLRELDRRRRKHPEDPDVG